MSSDYKDLEVWQLSMDITQDIYRITKMFPYAEKRGLCDQMRRASVSIPSNIAEGQCRASSKEFAHFLSISRGSCAELETQMILSQKLGIVKDDDYNNIINKLQRIGKMLNSLTRHLLKNKNDQQRITHNEQPATDNQQ